MPTTTSAFEKYVPLAWPYRYHGTMHIDRVCGGTPTDPKVAEGWLRTKLGATDEAQIQKQVAEVMAERGVTETEAVEQVNTNRHLNGFKRERCPECPPSPGEPLCAAKHVLYIEGRHLKAAIKEAASVAAATGKLPLQKWGKTGKWLNGFIAEHVCVVDDILPLGVTEPSGVAQRFVHTHRGTGIQYEEYVDGVDIEFTIITDYEFTEHQWAMIWLTGGQQGIGATRSQGYGKYTVTGWKREA